MSSNQPPVDPTLALARFSTVTQYLSYETTIFWTRSQFFLTANGALLTFVASQLLKPRDSADLTIVECALGELISVIWFIVGRSGMYWTARWEAICRSLEPDALGTTEMFRNPRPPHYISTKKVSRNTAVLFIAAWAAAILWVLLAMSFHL